MGEEKQGEYEITVAVSLFAPPCDDYKRRHKPALFVFVTHSGKLSKTNEVIELEVDMNIMCGCGSDTTLEVAKLLGSLGAHKLRVTQRVRCTGSSLDSTATFWDEF